MITKRRSRYLIYKKRVTPKSIRVLRVFIMVLFLLVILTPIVMLCDYFLSPKKSNYVLGNKFYSFSVTAPKDWIVESKSFYSEKTISEILYKCKNEESDSSSVYEIGKFRLKDKKNLDDFDLSASLPAGFSSGAILNITVNCVPGLIKEKINNYNSALKIGGERALEAFSDVSGSGKTKYISFFHDNLQYIISEHIYTNNNREDQLVKEYSKKFNQIISSIKFTHD